MRTTHPVILLCAAATLLFGCTAEREATMQKTGQHATSFTRTVEETYAGRYLLYLPPEYALGDRMWPLVLFLHGVEERGTDIELVKTHGPPKLVAQGRDFPFVLVSPQCPDDRWWDTMLLRALIDEIEETYRIDPDRIYVTGLSMGGYATWRLATEQPARFAAIVPVCGGGTEGEICVIRSLPVWAFHGAKDPVVPLSESQKLVNALKACGGNARLTIYPDAGHDAWTVTYNNAEMYDWLLQQRRGR